MNLDQIVAAHRPTPLPDHDVVAHHRAILDRHIAGVGSTVDETRPAAPRPIARSAAIIPLDDPRDACRSAHPQRSRHRLVFAAAAVLVVAATAGVLSQRSGVDPPASADTATAPTSATVAPFDPTVGQLLTAAVPSDARPLITVGEPGWTMNRYSGFDLVPENAITASCSGCVATRLVVASDGPLFSGPLLTAWTHDGDFEKSSYSSGFDTPVMIGSTPGRADSYQVVSWLAPEASMFTQLAWPIAADRWAFVEAFGFTPDQVVDWATSLTFDSAGPVLADVPAGFVVAPPQASPPVVQANLRFVSGDRTVEVTASNAGIQGLLDWRRSGGASNPMTSGWLPQSLDGATVAFFDPSTATQATGKYATWIAGGWAYSVIGYGFGTDGEFFDVLAALTLTDTASFDASTVDAQLVPIENWFES